MQRNSMIKGLIAGGLLVAVVLIAAIYFVLNRKETIVIDTDTTILGDYVVNDSQRLVLANGAILTVTGSMAVNGELDCQGGAIQLRIGEEFQVRDSLRCVSDSKQPSASGITVSAGSFLFDKTSTVVSDGSIQMVDRPESVLSAAQLEEVYADTEKDSGVGVRVGPLSATDGNQVIVRAPTATQVAESDLQPLLHSVFGVQTAQAQDGVAPVVISGRWQIVGKGGLPPYDLDVQTPDDSIQRVVIYFNFGKNGDARLQDLTLSGPDGHHGKNAQDTCSAVGNPGQDAMRLNVQAPRLTINNLKLTLGNGGPGGKAITKQDCENASATGGKGGKPGNFKLVATESFQITGAFEITPGEAGDGGEAQAYGLDPAPSCPGQKGGNATARGGQGGDSLKLLAATGTVGGLGNITIGDAYAGRGGDAYADAGLGALGSACGCAGGDGGNALAVGGSGGSATKNGTSAGAAVGGDGGNSEAAGGHAGSGGSCGSDKKGGNGGRGGSTVSTPGKGGMGATRPGRDGDAGEDKSGGKGGNGGDGCTEGRGGTGGSGEPKGADGSDGKRTCVIPTKKIKVISVGGKYIPVDQIHLANPDACSEKHWHGSPVTATDGTVLTDPLPGACGYCTESQCPILEIEVPDLKAEIRFSL
jgi:hypothetical protein